MKKFLVIIFLFDFLVANSQLGHNLYGGEGNDVIYQIIPAGNDEYYLLGARHIDVMEIWLAKINASDEIIWEETYGPNPDPNFLEIGYQLLVVNDSTFYIVGQARRKNFSDEWAILIKAGADGNKIWKKEYEDVSAIFDFIPDGDDFLAAGYYSGSGMVLRIDTSGNVITTIPQQISDQTYIHKIMPSDDGNFLLVGRSDVIGAGYSGIFVRKIKPTGEIIWTKIKDTGTSEYDFNSITGLFESEMGVLLNDDGLIWITNHYTYPFGIGLFIYDQNGNLLEEFNYGESRIQEFPTSLLKLSDGGWLISGSTENDSIFALKIGSAGREEWLRYYGKANTKSIAMTSVETTDHYLLGGLYQDNISLGSDYDATLFRIEKNGNPHPFKANGFVKFDRNNNCQDDTEDPGLENWFLIASDTDQSQFLLTDKNGYFEFNTSSNLAELRVINRDTSLWSICTDNFSLSFDSLHTVQNLLFLVQPNENCGELEVSLTQPDLMKCDTSCMTATIMNSGNMESDTSHLLLHWEKELDFISSSWPYQSVENGIEIEVPPIREQYEIHIDVCLFLDCDVQLGATHQIEASIEPLSCIDPYSGHFIELTGKCDGDEVLFSLTNSGGGGSTVTTHYSVYLNELLVTEDVEVHIAQGEEKIIRFPADGRTWRMEVEQPVEVPFPDIPSATVEACGTRNTGLHDIGLRSAFRSNDYTKSTSVVLAPNTSGAANKVAEAYAGLGTYNIILETGELEFTARVKNEFKDTVNEVIFDLTFSPTFSISTFQLLSSNVEASVIMADNHRIRITMLNAGIKLGEVGMARFRVHTAEDISPNTNNGFLRIQCKAFLDEIGPIQLSNGFHNYFQLDQAEYEENGIYPEYMRMYGGRNYDFGSAVVKGEGENLFLTGTSNSFGIRDYWSGYVYKTDLSGRVEWQSVVNPEVSGSTRLYGVQPDGEGGCIFSGSFLPAADAENYNYGYFYYGVIGRLDANGKIVWIKRLRPVGAQYGTSFDGVIKTSDHHYVAYGNVSRGESERVYVKFDIDGNLIWVKQEPFYKLDPWGGVALKDGGAYFVGGRLNEYDNPFPIVHEIDANGKILWEYAISTGVDASVRYIALTGDGGFMLAGRASWEYEGEFVETPIFIKCDSVGNRLWVEKPMVGDYNYFEITGVEKAEDGGFVAIGFAGVDSFGLDWDVILVKVDSEGKLLWYELLGGKKDEIPYDIEIVDDDIYVYGNDQPEIILYDLQSFLIKTNGEGQITSIGFHEVEWSKTATLVFPNPAAEIISIVLTPKPIEDFRWMICDMMGKMLLSGEGHSEDVFRVETSNLTSGSYIITFPGTSYPAKVIVIVR